jgi:D-xylose transport system ATP-binding protein
MSEQPLLEIRGLSKTFGAVVALDDVDFAVRSGEVMALVGDNGAGKSTLVKCIAGTYPADSGEILFGGEPVSIHGPKDAARLGIEVVYQDLALCDNLDVVQNMFLGREEMAPGILPPAIRRPLAPVLAALEHSPRPLRRMDEETMERRARETLSGLSVTTLRSVRQVVAGLSGGQRQSVAVAKAVLWNSRVVILDEPTAALGVAQTRQVLDLVKRLAQQGLAVVVITHNLHDVFEVADRITVLRLGHSVAVYEASQTNQREVVEAITAGKVSSVPGGEQEVTT